MKAFIVVFIISVVVVIAGVPLHDVVQPIADMLKPQHHSKPLPMNLHADKAIVNSTALIESSPITHIASIPKSVQTSNYKLLNPMEVQNYEHISIIVETNVPPTKSELKRESPGQQIGHGTFPQTQQSSYSDTNKSPVASGNRPSIDTSKLQPVLPPTPAATTDATRAQASQRQVFDSIFFFDDDNLPPTDQTRVVTSENGANSYMTMQNKAPVGAYNTQGALNNRFDDGPDKTTGDLVFLDNDTAAVETSTRRHIEGLPTAEEDELGFEGSGVNGDRIDPTLIKTLLG